MPRNKHKEGFTLMEVLIAVVIVGLTVAVFFQLISSSMRLSIKSRELLETSLAARSFFEQILDLDVREDDFDFEGIEGKHPWELKIYPIDVDEEKEDDGSNIQIKLPSELYEYTLLFFYSEQKKKHLKMSAYVRQKAGYFSEDFKDEHIF